MVNIWKKYLKGIRPYVPGKPIEEVKRELGLESAVKLASNENPLGPSAAVVRAVSKAVPEINRYPEGGCFYLRKTLAKKLGVGEDNLVFGNGSDELIVLALRASVDPDDEVVVASPTFQIYHIASMVEGAKIRAVGLKNFKYDLDGMLRAVTNRTKLVFIANPDNPTGSYVNEKELFAFLRKLPKRVVVFIDEAYYEYAKGGDYPETLSLVKKGKANVIVARTFSKVHSLAGLRVGYAVAKKEIADALNKVREPFNVNSLAQAAAVAALGDAAHVRRSLELARSGKKRFYSFFESVGVNYVPSRTNFVLAGPLKDPIKIYKYLLNKGVIVREMSGWGLRGFLRVTVGLGRENDKFFKAFREII